MRLNQMETNLNFIQQRLLQLQQSQNRINAEALLLQTQLRQLEQNRDSIAQAASQQIADNRAMMDQFQAQQLQTERALNLALDQFQDKFEQQNLVAARLEAQLEGQVNYQLIIMVSAFALLIVLFILLNRNSVRRSLATSQASWNQFQDYFLKNN